MLFPNETFLFQCIYYLETGHLRPRVVAYILNFSKSNIYRKSREYFSMLLKEKNQNAQSSNENNYGLDVS